MFKIYTIAKVKYYISDEEYEQDRAGEIAASKGLRLLSRGEICSLYDESKAFRNRLCKLSKNELGKFCAVYWTSSLDAPSRLFAWSFHGYFGTTESEGVSCPNRIIAVKA